MIALATRQGYPFKCLPWSTQPCRMATAGRWKKGALPFPNPFPEHYSKLRDWLQVHATGDNPQPKQLGLF